MCLLRRLKWQPGVDGCEFKASWGYLVSSKLALGYRPEQHSTDQTFYTVYIHRVVQTGFKLSIIPCVSLLGARVTGMHHRAQCLVSYGFVYHVGTPTFSTLNSSEQTSSVDHRAAAPLGDMVYTNSSLKAVLTNLLLFCPHDLGRGTKKKEGKVQCFNILQMTVLVFGLL